MKQMRLPLVLICLVLSSPDSCFSQTEKTIPKNFPGLFAGIEWNTISGIGGVSYERTLWARDRYTTGVKALYVFEHENGNMELITDTYDGLSSFSALLLTAHYFTSRNGENNSGFFLYPALGVGRRSHKEGEVKYNRTIAAFEAGFGWQLYAGKRTTLRWTNSLLFAGEGVITLTQLSLGF